MATMSTGYECDYKLVGKVDRKTTETTSALKIKFCNVILRIRGELQIFCRIPQVSVKCAWMLEVTISYYNIQ
jgi:hypothetical protein